MDIKTFDVEKEQDWGDWEVWAERTYIWVGKDYGDDIRAAQKILDAGGVANFYAHSFEWADKTNRRKREVDSIVTNPDRGMIFEETKDLLGTIKSLEEYFDFPESGEGPEVEMGWFIVAEGSLVLRKAPDWTPYIVRAEDREKVEELTGIDADAGASLDGEKAVTFEIEYPVFFY